MYYTSTHMDLNVEKVHFLTKTVPLEVVEKVVVKEVVPETVQTVKTVPQVQEAVVVDEKVVETSVPEDAQVVKTVPVPQEESPETKPVVDPEVDIVESLVKTLEDVIEKDIDTTFEKDVIDKDQVTEEDKPKIEKFDEKSTKPEEVVGSVQVTEL
ncbi:uncharacterized protein LOC113389599 [Ctenocephalides felis]|uniref:uncharacterized protein LOC113389599 n=1 Tax=Ctenocephalides felis TaxID=7515 RepID=UPI000E6E26B0|nr:uncharacterized protein LOC113389599 [Ctenocephalides felis]